MHAAARTPAGRSEQFERFRRDLKGALPAREASGVVLAACNDFYYWNFAITLILSVERQAVPQRLHLHLCEATSETLTHVETLAASLSHVSLTFTSDDGALGQGLRYRTVYYAAVRFLLAPLVLEATGAPLLCIDVDGIAAKPIWPAYEPVRQGADVVLIRRPHETSPTRRILASAVGFNPTEGGLTFANSLARALAEIMAIGPIYHVDQIAIHYLLGKTTVRVAEMPKALADHDFGPDSVIGTAKGWRMKESGVYRDAKQAVDSLFPGLASP